MNLQTIELNKLNPAPYNPRTIDEDEFAGLIESLKTFGQQENLIVNKDMTVISGHMRLQAMKQLEWAEATCNVVDLDKHEEKKLNVIMNSQAISGRWDDIKLAEILEELKLDEDYTTLHLDKLEPLDLSEVEIIEDEAPEVSSEPPVSELGKIYQLGRHRVMCGDSTDAEQRSLITSNFEFDTVYTDPPYGLGGYGGRNNMELKGDDLDVQQFYSAIPHALEMYIWGNYKNLKHLDAEPRDVIVWVKNNFGLGTGYRGQYELCFYYGSFDGSDSDVWQIDKDMNYEHPTQKPVALAARAFKNSGSKNVLDIYLGSGSTLIACEQTDRTCYGMEIDPKYVDVIRRRYWKFTHDSEEGWEEGTSVI